MKKWLLTMSLILTVQYNLGLESKVERIQKGIENLDSEKVERALRDKQQVLKLTTLNELIGYAERQVEDCDRNRSLLISGTDLLCFLIGAGGAYMFGQSFRTRWKSNQGNGVRLVTDLCAALSMGYLMVYGFRCSYANRSYESSVIIADLLRKEKELQASTTQVSA